MRIYFLMILSILLTSCFKNSKVTESSEPINTEIENRKQTYTKKDSVLIENKVMHSFSQMDKNDEFYICIKGKSIVEGKMIFKITNSDGTEILNEEFPSYLLIGYGLEEDKNSVKDKEEYIKSRIRDFFNEIGRAHV